MVNLYDKFVGKHTSPMDQNGVLIILFRFLKLDSLQKKSESSMIKK